MNYDYDANKDEYKYGWFTEDIYLSAWFYLTNRFGFPQKYDDYKEAGTFKFKVKDFIIQITFLSTYLEIIVFGEKWHYLGGLKIYDILRHRRIQQNKEKLLNHFLNVTNAEEVKFHNKHLNIFMKKKKNGINKNSLEYFTANDWDLWNKYVTKYNNHVLHIKEEDKLYNDYSNAYTRRALKTLTQFLHNMLTPIWIRDVSYNIKGRCDTRYQKYINNIDIQLWQRKQKEI